MTHDLLMTATRLRQHGKLAEAAAIYGDILRIEPTHFDALLALGILSYQTGQLESAEQLLGRAVRQRPDNPELAYNHACLLQKLNRFEEALAGFDRVLSVCPDYLEALVNRGAILRGLGRYVEALHDADRVVSLRPELIQGWCNRAAILDALGRPQEAINDLEHALSLDTGLAAAWKHRAVLLQKIEHSDEALASFRKAVEIAPADAEAQAAIADLLVRQGKLAEAADAYERYLALEPGAAGGWHARAFVLQLLHRREEALDSFNRALQLDPRNDAIRTGRANILFELERWDDAAADYEILLAAASPPAWLRGYLTICHLHCCDWRRLDEERSFVSASLKRGEFVIDPLGIASLSDSAEEQIQCAKIWARDRCPGVAPLWHGEHYRHARTRIAYLSADFRAHATAFLMAGVLERHDRRQFEVIAISWSANDSSPTRERVCRAVDQFVEVSDKSDDEIARIIRDLEIDIAIDLKGYTNESRPAILSSRPAPVQAQYLGFPGTMGVNFIDYIIADRIVIPKSQTHLYSEQICWLPDTYQCNDDRRAPAVRAPTRYEMGLPAGFVFCCFNSNHKILPDVFAVWMRLLAGTPGSVLWLLGDNAAAMQNLRSAAQAHGIDPERLVFAHHTDPVSHLARQRNADLFLDTLPYNAHTTASDALWAGLPLLTVRGATFAGCVAASLLTAAGLPELVTDSLGEYESLALALARDSERLRRIRHKLADARTTCPLFDTGRFTRNLEAAYDIMIRRSRQGLSATSFAVADMPS